MQLYHKPLIPLLLLGWFYTSDKALSREEKKRFGITYGHGQQSKDHDQEKST